jgi:4-hydroxy-4-methyl-2-oxoglutarate aldolase
MPPNSIYSLNTPLHLITMINFKQIEEHLNSSIISDVLGGMGVKGQDMGPDIRPVDEDMVLVGYAATMLMADQYDYGKDTFKLQFQAIDALKEGEVMMVAGGGTERAALWGELLSTAARYRGARGVVIDGMARDIKLIIEMGFPSFARGVIPTSSKGRVIAIDQGCPVEMGGVKVHQGDLVVADLDGIVVVPKDIIDEVIKKALEVASSETLTRAELKKGAGLYDVFKKYGTI